MSCPKTPHLLAEYFDESLSSVARNEILRHLDRCEYCAGELAALQEVQGRLGSWQQQDTPHWDRASSLFSAGHSEQQAGMRFNIWQWFPAAASLAMLVLVVFNIQVVAGDGGLRVSFGAGQTPLNEQHLQQQLNEFAEAQSRSQQQVLQLYLARLEDVREAENVRVMEAVMNQTRQFTAENLELMAAWIEQQRARDMQNLEAGYQQLVDSDMDTLLAMEQLASYVQYQSGAR